MAEVTREEFDELKKQVADNTTRLAAGDGTLKLIAFRMDQIDEKLDKLDLRVQALQDKPAKRWESISGTVLSWIVTALLAFIAVKIGLN